jgi:hypothetical protein
MRNWLENQDSGHLQTPSGLVPSCSTRGATPHPGSGTDRQASLCPHSAAGMYEGLGLGPRVRVGGEAESLGQSGPLRAPVLGRATWRQVDGVRGH